MLRVAGHQDQHLFKVTGVKVFGEFMDAALPTRGIFQRSKRILDWGCGCGRVTVHLMSIEDGPQVLGCDIDPFAIHWCNKTSP